MARTIKIHSGTSTGWITIPQVLAKIRVFEGTANAPQGAWVYVRNIKIYTGSGWVTMWMK